MQNKINTIIFRWISKKSRETTKMDIYSALLKPFAKYDTRKENPLAVLEMVE